MDNYLNLQHVIVTPDGEVTSEAVGARGNLLSSARIVAVAIDRNDGVHIAFQDGVVENDDTEGPNDSYYILKYAHKPYNGSFAVTDVDINRGAGWSPAITVAADGGVHIFHVLKDEPDDASGNYRYVYKPNGGSFDEPIFGSNATPTSNTLFPIMNRIHMQDTLPP